MKEYYIKALGSTCYNHKGLTFPVEKRWGTRSRSRYLGTIVSNFLIQGSTYWDNAYGWNNQPEVLVFRVPEGKTDLLDKLKDWLYKDTNHSLLVVEKDWITLEKRTHHRDAKGGV